jgi:integrase
MAVLSVPMVGSLVQTNDSWEPFRLVDPTGAVVDAASAFFRDLQAAGRSEATIRSYGMDLLRWFRFLWAIEVPWQRATRVEARDFRGGCWWQASQFARTGDGRRLFRRRGSARSPTRRRCARIAKRSCGRSTTSIWMPAPGRWSTRFRWTGRGEGAVPTRITIRWNQTGTSARACIGPSVSSRIPRSIPDEEFNKIFARLPSHRYRALVAFYVSTGARASELLSATQGGVDPGSGAIAVTRRGSRAIQELPASSDAFVWLRASSGPDAGPCSARPTSAAVVDFPNSVAAIDLSRGASMFERAGQAAGSTATLHALRHIISATLA